MSNEFLPKFEEEIITPVLGEYTEKFYQSHQDNEINKNQVKSLATALTAEAIARDMPEYLFEITVVMTHGFNLDTRECAPPGQQFEQLAEIENKMAEEAGRV